MAKLPRGLRNHNPLNIRKSASKWQGMDDVQPDKEFITFITNEWGYRAAFRTILTYMKKYNLCTIHDIVSRWAPANENNTRVYILTVVERSGIDEFRKLYWTCKEDMVKLVMAMSYVENGIPAIKQEVEDGYQLAFGY